MKSWLVRPGCLLKNGRRWVTLLAAVLAGFAVSSRVSASDDGVLTLSGKTVDILELRCNTDKSVTATAIVGDDGAILHSNDGGLSWLPAAVGGDFKGVAPRFFDDPRDRNEANKSLVVAGYKSTAVLQSTYPLGVWKMSPDGGRTWSTIPARLPPADSRDPIGWPPRLVMVNGDGRLATFRQLPLPVVLTSDDQGATWNGTRLPLINTDIYHLVGDGRGRLVAVGSVRRGFNSLQQLFGQDRLVVVQSDDGGKTWSVTMDEVADHLNCSPRMMTMTDGGMLIYNPCPAYGRRYYLSSDGGRTWSARVFERHYRGAFELMTAVDSNRWIALSRERSGGSLFAWISDNGGIDWRGQPTGFADLSGDPWLHMQSMVTLSGGSILAYVSDGQVIRSADRGESWQIVDTGLPRKRTFWLEGHCTDRQELVVLGGSKGMLIRSLDGGLTWEQGRMAPP